MQQNSSASNSNLTISDNNGNPMASNNSSNITNIAGMVAGNGNDTNMVMQLMSMTNSITNSAMNNNVSSNLSISITILLSFLIIVSFISNALLLFTILSSKKLRKKPLYLLFCEFAAMNIIDILLVMGFSLKCIYQEVYFEPKDSSILCRMNAFIQEFLFQKILLTITLMGIERAVGLKGPHLTTMRYFGILESAFLLVPVIFASPVFLPSFSVEYFHTRHLCAIGARSPIAYSVVKIFVYTSCLSVLLVCFGALLRHKTDQRNRSLPLHPQDYRAFIIESRTLQDHLSLGRLVLLLTAIFLILEGPFICLDFFLDIRNSTELLKLYEELFDFPEGFESIIVWIKCLHPVISSLSIFFWCCDIRQKFVELFFSSRNSSALVTGGVEPGRPKNSVTNNYNNVLTLVATTDGLQLVVPAHQQHSSGGLSARVMPMNLPPVEQSASAFFPASSSVITDERHAKKQKEIEEQRNQDGSDSPELDTSTTSINRPLVRRTRKSKDRNEQQRDGPKETDKAGEDPVAFFKPKKAQKTTKKSMYPKENSNKLWKY